MQTMGQINISTEHNGYRITAYYCGGRTADVYIAGKCVDCVQVCDYDWERGEIVEGSLDVGGALKKWAEESGDDFIRELPYL